MGVPAEIRQVKRPRNTVVVDRGENHFLRYAVRERAGAVCKTGHNPQPRNGRTIGHIINGVYVPVVRTRMTKKSPEWLSYGSSALIESQSRDILSDLLAVFHPCDAYKIMTIAMLKIVHPGVTHHRLAQHYNRTFAKVFYPNVCLSSNTVSNFVQILGQNIDKCKEFYQRRIDSVCSTHHIAVDGTLKQNTSKVNSLSSFSRKSRVSGCKDISIIYAYDIDTMEPICAQVFAGNIIDAKAYRIFIKNNNIIRGVIITDKGFPPSKIKYILSLYKDLHFMTPLKRNDKRIIDYNMLCFDGVLNGIERRVLYKKIKTSKNLFLYSFRDTSRSQKEENRYIDKIRKNGNYDKADYNKKIKSFGTIVFLSDLDMTPETAWHCYEDRWMIELIFDYYKNNLFLNETRVQSEASIWGEEFINFISTLITCRIIRKSEKLNLFEKMTFGEMMEDLEHVLRPIKGYKTNEIPEEDDDKWMNTTDAAMEILIAHGLAKPSIPPNPEPKKRGRRKKQPDIAEPERSGTAEKAA